MTEMVPEYVPDEPLEEITVAPEPLQINTEVVSWKRGFTSGTLGNLFEKTVAGDYIDF